MDKTRTYSLDVDWERVYVMYNKYAKRFPEGKYRMTELLKECPEATHRLIFGQRGPGKTTSTYVFMFCLYKLFRAQTGYIMRYAEDLRGGLADDLFTEFEKLPYIREIFKDEKWTEIVWIPYRKGFEKGWYLARRDEESGSLIYDTQPFMRPFALTKSSSYKGRGYPNIALIFFDEFMPENRIYLQNEFSALNSIISTIRRDRTYVKVIMCANAIDKNCMYFYDFGISSALDQEIASICLYTKGNIPASELSFAVERTDIVKNDKVNNFFAFNDNNSKMITSGEWDLEEYPHLPCKYCEADIVFIYFIIHRDRIYQCEIIRKNGQYFTYIHRKTTEIKDMGKDIIFSKDPTERMNIRRSINHPFDNIGRKIWYFFSIDKVFYQDNTVGNAIDNFING